MEKYILLFVIAFHSLLCCQRLEAQITAGSQTKTFQTPNPKVNPYKVEEDMPHMYFSALFQGLSTSDVRSGGIVADNFGSGGRVDLSVHIYDETQPDGKGNLIYSCYSDESSNNDSDFIEKSTSVTVPSTFSQEGQTTNITVQSTDIKQLLQATSIANTTCTRRHLVNNYAKSVAVGGGLGISSGCATGGLLTAWSGPFSFLGCVAGAFAGGVAGIWYNVARPYQTVTEEQYTCLKKVIPAQRIIVEVSIANARLKKIKVPVLGEKNISELFDTELGDFSVSVFVNGKLNRSISYPQQGGSPKPTVSLTMGDSVSFVVQVNKAQAQQQAIAKPEIHGVPHTWVAAFAGDLKYHCNPDVQPGEVRPFIGFDSRVHTLMLRPYPENFAVREPDWVESSSSPSFKTYTWSWTADREMSSAKSKYTGYYTWPKVHIRPDGTVMNQRQNQKEGLNIQYLTYFDNWRDANYSAYNNNENVRYMLGFDDDELGYFNHPFAQATSLSNSNNDNDNEGLVKLDSLIWKAMPEGKAQEYSDQTGFPEWGFPLNLAVTAYRRFQASRTSAGAYSRDYNGYEIQDENTGPTYPDGNGSNNAHPGLITVQIGEGLNQQLQFKLNAASPLDPANGRSLGFYEALEGPGNPSYGEENVQYSLLGIENKSPAEKAKYSLAYSFMDRLGNIVTTEKRLGSSSSANFDINRPAYAWITAYYQRTPASRKVPIAGKEITPIFLMFCGVKTYNGETFPQGKGHGSKIFLEDIRNQPGGIFQTQKNYGTAQYVRTRYINKYTNTYVVPLGTTLTFTTFDGDPHRFDSNEEEWYLSSRSMAKRVKDNMLDGTSSEASEAALKYYVYPSLGTPDAPIINNRSGKDLTYTFSTAGTFDLKVAYRNTSVLYNQIKVINYSDSQQGIIKQGRDLTPQEKRWLGITTSAQDYKAYEVADVYSKFLWADGARNPNAPTGKPNRWALYNDYLNAYVWERGGDTKATNDMLVNTLTSNYNSSKNGWFWKDWALHYSSNWLRPEGTNGQGIPNYVSESVLTRIKSPSDLSPFNGYIESHLFNVSTYANQLRTPWQFVIPLVSYTDYNGYRFRTNPSCIYDLRQVFSPTNGAFTGSPPNPADPTSIQAPDISDSDKDLMAFYHDVFHGRILIIPNLALGTELRAYQKTPAYAEGYAHNGMPLLVKGTYVASLGITSSGGNGNRVAYYKAPQEVLAESKRGEATIVYPNESAGVFYIMPGTDLSELIELTVFSPLGERVYAQTSGLQREPITIELKSLPQGVYMLSLRGKENTENRKIIKR